MRLTKLTAYSSLFIILFTLGSCDRDNEADERNVYRAKSLPMNAAQQIPTNASLGSGTIDATYDKGTKTLTYTINWSGLSGAAAAAHIHGVASRGSVALPPPLGTYPNGIIQTFSGFPKGASGSYTGTIFCDEVVVKEADILNGKLYIDLHTPSNTLGEIRGQVEF